MLLTPKDIKTFTFPDGQPHVVLPPEALDNATCELEWPIRNPLELVQLMMICEVLDHHRVFKDTLFIPYLMGARFDRRMQPGDSVDLKVVANVINDCNFDEVQIFDVHSDTALQLIDSSTNIDNSALIRMYNQPDAVLICPDAGAAKKTDHYLKSKWNLKELVYCIKSRNMSDGKITLKVLEPEKCKGRNCVIIDDLCDGGATFLAIAQQIEPRHLTLIVSHGIFSKGLDELKKHFQHIITSDSYKTTNDPIVTTIPVRFE